MNAHVAFYSSLRTMMCSNAAATKTLSSEAGFRPSLNPPNPPYNTLIIRSRFQAKPATLLIFTTIPHQEPVLGQA